MAPPRIAICGEVGSTNLGDPVIARSLAYLLQRARPDALVSLLDLSGRDDWADARERETVTAQRCGAVSPSLRDRAESVAARCGVGPMVPWRRQLRELRRTAHDGLRRWPAPGRPFDLVVIGGGQLLVDNDLWFLSRLWLLRRRLGPWADAMAIHACGVGATWSPAGRLLGRRLLADPRLVSRSVRDASSAERAMRHLGCPVSALAVVPDPAVWAAEAFERQRDRTALVIGVGVMAPPATQQGADVTEAGWLTHAFLMHFWSAVLSGLDAAGHEVVLFTNGAPDDQAVAQQVWDALPDALRCRVVLQPRMREGDALVQCIARCRAVISPRLHALVVAHSLGVPAVGLVWDDKVRQFGVLSGHPERMLEAGRASPERALHLLQESMAVGIDAGAAARLRHEAEAGVTAMVQAAGLQATT